MKWVLKRKAEWPFQEMPKEYFKENPRVPTLGAMNEIFVSLIQAVERLEAQVDSLERQVNDLMQWP